MHSLEQDTIEEAWYAALEPEFSKPYFRKLKQFLAAEMKSHTIYPAAADIYSWSRLTPLDQVKVVILGQDPYHDVNQAHGLAFSVLPPTKPPPSLRNIYKQLAADIPGFIPPAFGDLSPLARAGVLFLNTSLSVRAHKAASHSGRGWEEFTQAALRAVLDAAGDKGVVFMAWGLHAQKTCASTKHLVLKSAHPSPLSARRGFLGNGHFATANEWLKERYGEYGVVDWRVLSEKR
ncbi:uracil-DNA glycosylase [Punctularia strigosozonata HHB-11173 SS5]|uniref:uracil-DNA glycosylase n=1 Tax=Punctularia strigosozonata (strain HHB-11173) TaxID=741275 RepID=UPI0004418227|nr:uracil-DNA glycosylase [Punctularia strigosozonata HHB-11173 SS5]EIN08047.1 uracil-DNA glycosylase [Punctularia strigosozonata HHB-11173 SS5]